MPPRTSTDLNLSVLTRYFPRIHRILTTASYAVIYTWTTHTSSWQKSGIEGSLFICSLLPSPPPATAPAATTHPKESKIILLNRRGLDNFSYDIVDPTDIDYAEGGDYIMLRSPKAVYGLWVYSEPGTSTAGDKERVAKKIKECAAEYSESVADAGAGETREPERGEQKLGRRISLADLFKGGEQSYPSHTEGVGVGGGGAMGGDVLMRLFERASGSYRGAPP